MNANEVFKKWYDIDRPNFRGHRLTILDDKTDIYRSEDLARIKEVSDIIGFSQKEALRDMLAA